MNADERLVAADFRAIGVATARWAADFQAGIRAFTSSVNAIKHHETHTRSPEGDAMGKVALGSTADLPGPQMPAEPQAAEDESGPGETVAQVIGRERGML